MKVKRWEEETDEEWAERLAEEIIIANNIKTTQYFVERESHTEDGFIINYVGKDSWTWKEHPEGPFNCKQVLEWKLKAKRWDEVASILPELVGHYINDYLKSYVDKDSDFTTNSEEEK